MQFLLGIFIFLVAIDVLQRIVTRISYWICIPFGLNYNSPIPKLEKNYNLDALLKELGYKFEDYIPGSDCELLVNCEGRRRYEAICRAREQNAFKGRILTGFVLVFSIGSMIFYYIAK